MSQYFIVLVYFLIFAAIANSSSTLRSCKKDAHCANDSHYCSTKTRLCTVKYERFCMTNDDCNRPKEMCAHVPSVNADRGTCIPNPYLHLKIRKTPLPNLSTFGANVKEAFIVELDASHYNSSISSSILSTLPVTYDEVRFAHLAEEAKANGEEAPSSCGNERLEKMLKPSELKRLREHLAQFRKEQANLNQNSKNSTVGEWYDCAYGSCDNPVERDKFSSSPQKVILIQLNVITGDSFALEAAQRIAAATSLLNLVFQRAGFSFESRVVIHENAFIRDKYIYFDCEGRTGCITGTDALTRLIGTDWANRGSFQLLAHKIDSSLNGYAQYPASEDHGQIIIGKHVVDGTSTTISHEFGHSFFLFHTHKGITENPCGVCHESTASDVRGDLVLDTEPHPKSFACGPASGSDPCNVLRTSWPLTPYKNIMSYSSCRTSFTPIQERRMRCWFTQFFRKFYK